MNRQTLLEQENILYNLLLTANARVCNIDLAFSGQKVEQQRLNRAKKSLKIDG